MEFTPEAHPSERHHATLHMPGLAAKQGAGI